MTSLFDSVQLGEVTLQNRIVMAPMTRARAASARVPNDLMRTYYSQRASAGLIITEGTIVSPLGAGYRDTPGIWCKAQVEGWRSITRAVHDKGGKIFLQLWHVGRVSDPEFLSGEIPVAPSAIACAGQVSLLRPKRDYVTPRTLHVNEIRRIVGEFEQAARNAKQVGFDGVEIHAANGYLVDQFLHDGSNHRTDEYGGPVRHRSRFLLEIVDACIGVWGAGRVGVHLSPRGDLHDMHDGNPAELFGHAATELGWRRIAFLCLRERPGPDSLTPAIRKAFGGRIIANEGFGFESASQAVADGDADAVAFAKLYVANPDLVHRLRQGLPLNAWDSDTFYTSGAQGYTDYPCANASDCEAQHVPA